MSLIALVVLVGRRPAGATHVQDIGDLLRPPPFRKLRAEESCDYLRGLPRESLGSDALKFWPLGDFAWSCVGGSLRLRVEWSEAPELGEADEDGTVFLHRTMTHVGLGLGDLYRGFLELVIADADGRLGGPSPVDANRLDIHQGFLEVAGVLGDARVLGRVGRQELAFGRGRLVDVREGPNVRQSFEAIRIDGGSPGLRATAFVGQPVETRLEPFDDLPSTGEWLWGFYSVLESERLGELNFYYLGYRDPRAVYQAGEAEEVRHSVGFRFHLVEGGFDTDIEAVAQFGTFGSQDILAWTLASNSGYRLASLPTAPRLGLSLNVASGDSDPGDDVLETFNALFPRGNYFGQLVLVGPANFFDIHPFVTFELANEVLLSIDWEMFWRFSTADAVYQVNRRILRPAEGSDARFVAHIVSASLDWQVHRNLGLFFTYGQVFDGQFIADTGAVEGTTRLFESSIVLIF